MNKIVVMGECMVELSPLNSAGHYQQSFAGDVFNTGIYIKRCLKQQAQVSFLTAIGQDATSDNLLAMMASEQLDNQLVYHSDSANMGLYMINLDEAGERSFSYWRSHSAARQLVSLMEKNNGIEPLNNITTFFFSGISLAILPQQDLPTLWRYLYKLKQQGTEIVFDPNYRPSLWQSPQHTRQAYETAFSLSDVVLPGVDDHIELYGAKNAEQVADYLSSFGIDEIVIKNGEQGILTCVKGERSYLSVTPVAKVVDTTSAGDAFNGAYLSARLAQKSVNQAALFAAKVAGCVIGHRGAIVPDEVFQQQLQGALGELG